MKLATSIALAVSLVGAALLYAVVPASAAPWEKRVALTPREVVTDGRWEALAEALHLPWSFDKMFGNGATADSLPTPCSGQMYGGAWGIHGSPSSDVLAGSGWVFWGKIAGTNGNIPGVLAIGTPDGVIVHAEKGASGTAFFFVAAKYGGEVVVSDNGKPTEAAVAEADRLATDIATAVKEGKKSKLWNAFSNAVAATPTGVSVDEMAIVLGVERDANGHLLKDGKRVIGEAPGSSAGGTADTSTKAKADADAKAKVDRDAKAKRNRSALLRQKQQAQQPPKPFPWWWVVAAVAVVVSFAMGWFDLVPFTALIGLIVGALCGVKVLGISPPPPPPDPLVFVWAIGGGLICYGVAFVASKARGRYLDRLDDDDDTIPPRPAAPGGEEEFEI